MLLPALTLKGCSSLSGCIPVNEPIKFVSQGNINSLTHFSFFSGNRQQQKLEFMLHFMIPICIFFFPSITSCINATSAIQENLELMGDDYQGDVLGESTPDVLVSEFVRTF